MHDTRKARRSERAPRTPVDTNLRDWLTIGGSLTGHLRAGGSVVTVHVLRQGGAAALDAEAGLTAAGRLHAREVLLSRDGQVLVYARSTTPARAVRGPWRALLGLGSRPLAELLFDGRRIRRSPLVLIHIGRHSPLGRHISRHIAQQCRLAGQTFAATRHFWGRHSVFTQGGQPLRVMEVFVAPMPGRVRAARGGHQTAAATIRARRSVKPSM